MLVKDLGADLNMRTVSGDTALHWAASKGGADVARVLVREFGADVNSKQNDGWTPLHWAASEGHTDVIIVLSEYGADVAATRGCADAARALQELGAEDFSTERKESEKTSAKKSFHRCAVQ